jgi:hypothetical protein
MHWCIKVTEENKDYLNNFLKEHSDEWGEYSTNWKCKFNKRHDIYFHYPPVNDYAHSFLSIEKGYIEITVDKLVDNYEIF